MAENKQYALVCKQFPTTEDWLKHWLCVFFRHTEQEQHVFYGNSSFMDLGEMLREASTFIDACAIYDTDISTSFKMEVNGNKFKYRSLTFYICYRVHDSLDGEGIERAKEQCLDTAEEFVRFLYMCKCARNPNVTTLELDRPVRSRGPVLDGWQVVEVGLQYYVPFCAIPTWEKYGL